MSSNTLVTWCEGLTHWKRPWCWESLKAGGEGDNREWDGWMASLTWWTWVWASFRSWNRQGSLACCGPWGHRVGHDWATELNWTEETIQSTCMSPLWTTRVEFYHHFYFGLECAGRTQNSWGSFQDYFSAGRLHTWIPKNGDILLWKALGSIGILISTIKRHQK